MKKASKTLLNKLLCVCAVLLLVLPMMGIAWAEEVWEADGSSITKVTLQWRTADRGVEDGNVNLLSFSTDSDATLSMDFQLEVSFSGENDYAPGTVRIAFPAQIMRGRDGRLMGRMDLSVPAAPATAADFNWQKINGEYVLTNTRTLSAASSVMIQGTILDIVPHNVDNLFISEPFAAACQVVTHKGNVITRSSEELSVQVNTRQTLTNAHKNSNNELYEELPGTIPQRLLANLPENTDPNDYIYIRWYTYVHHRGNQPFMLTVKDTLAEAYEETEEGKKIVSRGVLLGSTNVNGEILEDGSVFTATVMEDQYHATSTSGYDHAVYLWSAYPRANFRVPLASEPQVTYYFENTAEWTLTETDGGTTATKSDVAQVIYSPVRWEPPLGHFNVHKWTESASAKDKVYGYALNRLRSGENYTLLFQQQAVGFGYPWTSPETTGNPEEAAKESYGTLGWRQVIDDRQTFFAGDNTPLTWEDFEFDSLRVTKPTRYAYTKTTVPRAGYYEKNGAVASGTVPAGRYGYFADSSLPVPDMKIEYQVKGSGQWLPAAVAQWGEDGKGECAFIDLGNGITADGMIVYFPENTTDVRWSFVSNVFGGKVSERSDVAAIIWNAYPTLTLKPSENVLGKVNQLFSMSDTPSAKFKNDVHMTVDGWVNGSGEGTMILDDADLMDISRATLCGASYGVSLNKSVRFNRESTENGGDNDVARQRVILHYSATVKEQSNLTQYSDYQEAVAAGIIPAETAGVWYDLLPEGVYPLLDTVKLRSGDTIENIYTVPNWRGSGRTMLVVEAKLTPAPKYNANGYADQPSISFDAAYSWEDINVIGTTTVNYIAFESKTENLRNNTLGSITGEKAEPDDPKGGNNVTTPVMDSELAGWLKDLDPATDENRFLYGKATQNVNANISAVTGVSKAVMSDLVGTYSTGLNGQEQVTVYEGTGYNYRLRVKSAAGTLTRDIVLYDSVENYRLPDPATDSTKKDDYTDQQSKLSWQGDWQNKGQWRGTLVSVDAGEFKRLGAAPKVYYSLIPELQFAQAGTSSAQDGTLAIFSQGSYDLTDTAIWQQAQLNANGVWTVPANLQGRVSAIAVDAREKADGTAFELGENKSAAVYLHMTAPDDNGDENVWNAKGAFAHKTASDGTALQEVDWEKAQDPANNMYAYNNTFLKCTQSGTLPGSESRQWVMRNDYTRVGIAAKAIRVTKEWKDQNNHDNLRPESVTVTLLRKIRGGEYETVTDIQGAAKTVELSAANNWTAVFDQLKAVDAQGNPYLYTVTENAVDGYTLTLQPDGDNAFTLINSHPNAQKSLSGEKIWEDDGNALGLRPESITLTLYRDGKYVRQITVRPDSAGRWRYTFGNLDKYAQGGREYVYTVEEDYVPKYAADTQDVLKIKNIYDPFGELSIEKQLENVTEAAKDKEFTFTLTLLAEKTGDEEPAPLMDEYTYKVFRLEDGEWTENRTGTISCSGQFTLRGGEKIVVYDLPSESTYAVEENEVPGFTLTESVNASGMIRANRTAEAVLVNRYSSKGSVQLAVTKKLNGQVLTFGSFRFELYAIEYGDNPDTQMIRVAYNNNAAASAGGKGEALSSTAPAYFGQLNYTEADNGKTFQYGIVEKNDAKPGYTYDDAQYMISVTVTDNGDGTMTAVAKTQDGKDATDPASIVFENEYKAEGETVLRAFKQLLKRDLKDGEFTFTLASYDEVTGMAGDIIATVTNDAEGNVVFPALKFMQDHVSSDKNAPAVYSYLVQEKAGEDETVIYSEQQFVYRVSVHDNKDGTLSFGQEVLKLEDGTLTELYAAPVFVNDLHDGELIVSKTVEGENPDPEQEFNFRVKFAGEFVPPYVDSSLQPPELEEEEDEVEEEEPSDTPIVWQPFHATEEQLQGDAYAVFDIVRSKFTFFRADEPDENGLLYDQLGRAFSSTFVEGRNVVSEDLIYYQVQPSTDRWGYVCWPWDGDFYVYMPEYLEPISRCPRTVEMAGAIKPTTLESFLYSFEYADNVDLSLLDTSAATSMKNMFGWLTVRNEYIKGFDTSNVTDMAGMFSTCSDDLDLSHFDMSKVTNFQRMLGYPPQKLNISSFGKVNQPLCMRGGIVGEVTSAFEVTISDQTRLSSSDFPTSGPGGLCHAGLTWHNVETGKELKASKLFTEGGHGGTWRVGSIKNKECVTFTIIDPNGSQADPVTEVVFRSDYDSFYVDREHTVFVVPEKEIVALRDVNTGKEHKMYGNIWLNPYDMGYAGGSTVTLEIVWGDIPSCTVVFDANGGSGSMPTQKISTEERTVIVPTFTRMGYRLAGLSTDPATSPDSTDYSFFRVIDGKVTVPYYYFDEDQQYTLYAIWEKNTQQTELEDDMLTFTLKAGEAKGLFNLPASIAYEVWEETPAGWVLVEKTNDTGVIEPLKTAEAEFTNEWQPDAVKVWLRASKTVDGLPAEDTFEFALLDADGQTIETVESTAGGGIAFTALEFDKNDLDDSPIVYYLKEIKGEDDTLNYDETVYRAEIELKVETVEEEEILSAEVTYYKGEETAALTNAPVFRNTHKPGALKIEKTVSGATAMAAEQEFTAEVTFTDKNREEWNGEVKVDGSAAETVNGAITLQIKGGETVTVSDIPANVRYEVKETGSYPGWTMDETVHTGVIESTKTDDVKFTNMYSAKGTAVIEAEKNLIGRTPRDGEFTFTLTDANDTVVGTATNAYVQVQTADGYAYKHIAAFPEITYTAEGEYTYEITETQGNDETVEYAEAPLKVTVKVEDTEGRGRLTATVTYEGGSNVITNKVKTGALSLTKKVENAKEMHVDKAFAFTVYLADNQGQPLSGEYILNDTDVIAFTGGAGSLTLKDGETAVISGLPHGANYSIVEDAEDGFRQSCTGETGTIAIDETAAAVFTNTYSAEGEYRFEGVKVLQNAELEAGQFTFELIGSDGLPVESVTNDAEGNFAFAVLHYDDSDAGEKTYTVCEIAGSLPGVTYDKTTYEVTLTITDNGDGTLSITAEGAEEGIVFTNRYDERDDETIPVSFTVTKEWQGGGGGAIQLTLYADGEKMDPQPACERDGDRYTYNNLQKYKNGRAIVYSAKERYVDGFIAIYDNVAPYEGESRMIYNGGTIINRKEKVPSFTVTKVWQGLGKEKAPKIELILCCNGVETDVKTPAPNSRGEYRYYDLPETVNGEPAVYTVKEKPLAGYTVKYELANGTESDHADNGGRIINTRIPATGDGFTPMMWLMLMALSLLTLTGIRKRQMK